MEILAETKAPPGIFSAMPRKPYLSLVGRKRRTGTEKINIGGDAFNKRPDLQRIVGACLMSWPFLEMELALLLGKLLGSPNEAAIAVFQIIRRSSTQRDAILEAGRHSLNSEDQELLSAVMNMVGAVEAERNALAHGHFGISNLLPKDLVWQNTVDYIAHQTNVILRGQTEWNNDKHEAIVRNLFVYTKKDLEIIREDMILVGHITKLFLRYLTGQSLVLRKHLHEFPRVNQELKKLRKKGPLKR